MNDPYVQKVIMRSRELELLDRAAEEMPDRHAAPRWIAAAVLGLFSLLYPLAGAAQAFSYCL